MMLWGLTTIASQANAFTSSYKIALRCHVGSCKGCPKTLLWLIKKEHGYVHTHTHSNTHAPTLQRLQSGRPVSSGASASAIWVLFAFGQGPGQAAQYTTVFAERERKRERKLQACETLCMYKEACMSEYVLVVGILHVCVFMSMCMCLLYTHHMLSSYLSYWLKVSLLSQPPLLHHQGRGFFVLTQRKQRLGYP